MIRAVNLRDIKGLVNIYKYHKINLIFVLFILCFSMLENVRAQDSVVYDEGINQKDYLETQYLALKNARMVFDTNPKKALSNIEEILVYIIDNQIYIEQEKDESYKNALSALKGEAYMVLGDFNFQNKLYSQALENYLKSHESYEIISDQSIPYNLIRNISFTYRLTKKYKSSLKYYLKLEILALENKRYNDLINAKNEIGELYYILEKPTLAESYHLEALELSSLHHYYHGVKSSSENLAELALKIKEDDNEANFMRQQQRIGDPFNYRKRDDRVYNLLKTIGPNGWSMVKDSLENRIVKTKYKEREIQVNASDFSDELLRQNKINRDILNLKDQIFIAKNKNNHPELSQALYALYKLYENNGKSYLALETFKAYHASKDSLKINLQPKEVFKEESNFIEELKFVQSKLSYLEKEKNLDIQTIEVLKQQQTLDKEVIRREKYISILLTIGLILFFIVSILFFRLNRSRKRANELLRLKGLQAQMNPHFIFNTLNSVNNFISKNDERSANRYISDFSKLMRKVLELAQEDLISLDQELEMLSLYLKLEHLRFKDKFDYQLEIDESLESQDISIPPMLIQPFIENAIWHGLRYIESNGRLIVKVLDHDQYCSIIIDDNGIGRVKSAELKTKNQKSHNSTALKNIETRLSYIKKIYKKKFELKIVDKTEGKGTIIYIKLFK